MSAKHTPGPWSRTENGRILEIPIRATDCEKEGFSIAYIITDSPQRRAVAYANARLIAAAPDLLEALRYIVGCSAPMTPQQEQCWPVMRAAIAKATGQKGAES